jgi:hypothetical protein
MAFAQRDWEYWNQEQATVPVTKRISLIFNSEWRFKADMHDMYQFKQENGISFKITNWFDFAPYYVFQRKKGNFDWDGSDLMYLDEVFKFTLKKIFHLKVNNRFRYQYDFDKRKTVLRNTLRLSRDFPLIKHLSVWPFISEEPFYDCKINRINEHRSTVGFGLTIYKNITASIGYMINSKKPGGKAKWSYVNALISNLSITF